MVYLIVFILAIITYICIKKPIIVLRIKENIIVFMVIAIIICMVCFSKSSIQMVSKSIMLWANSVLPALLPFFICIEILKQSNFIGIIGNLLNGIMYPLFGVPGCGIVALIMGIISGYPIGAKITNDLFSQKLCTKQEAERLLAFTNSSGPLFIIGAIGTGMLKNEKLGIILFITHFLASITVGILLKLLFKSHQSSYIIPQVSIKSNNNPPITTKNLGKIMSISIQNSFSTLFLIMGYMVFFAVFSNFLSSTKIAVFFEDVIGLTLSKLNISQELSRRYFYGAF